jgi:uncharacterized paraquat-inducible protein A
MAKPKTVGCPNCQHEIVIPTGALLVAAYCPRCGADVPDLKAYAVEKVEEDAAL